MERTTHWVPPTPAVAERLRSVTQRLMAEPDEMLREVDEAVLSVAAPLADDPTLAEEARASNRANMTRWTSETISHPERPPRIVAPLEAVDLARDMVRRGVDPGVLLTAYRRAQNVAWRHLMRCAIEETEDPDELLEVLDTASRSAFGYVDGIIAILQTQMDEERDAIGSGALTRRRETVAMIVDGSPITEARASARLGYELGRPHTALTLWSTEPATEPATLEETLRRLSLVSGRGGALSVPAGRGMIWAWHSGDAPDQDAWRQVLQEAPAGIRATVGERITGIAGFRESHLQAMAARRVLMRRPDGPRMAGFGDVRVASLASQNERLADAFVVATLGELLDAPPELHETLRVYLEERGNAPRAAARLHTHRNTVLKRVARAQKLLPPSASAPDHTVDITLALELVRWSAPVSPPPRRPARPDADR